MATWQVTSMLRRLSRRPGRASASSPLRALARSGRGAAQAGATPRRNPLRTLTAKLWSSTDESTGTLRSKGTGTGKRRAPAWPTGREARRLLRHRDPAIHFQQASAAVAVRAWRRGRDEQPCRVADSRPAQIIDLPHSRTRLPKQEERLPGAQPGRRSRRLVVEAARNRLSG